MPQQLLERYGAAGGDRELITRIKAAVTQPLPRAAVSLVTETKTVHFTARLEQVRQINFKLRTVLRFRFL